MFTFLRNVKKSAEFFSINPEGLSFKTEQRLKDIEASVNKLPQAIADRNFTNIMNLEHDIYELKQSIKNIQDKLDEEQVASVRVLPKEEVNTELTQVEVNRLFEYRDGELYWNVDQGDKVKKGDKAGFLSKRQKFVIVNGKTYTFGRVVFLMFHGYLPERVSFIDGNPFNTRIENLKKAIQSSGYRGVALHKPTGKYSARIYKKGKPYHLGYFNTPKEAYKAYCKAAKKLHGKA